MEDGSGESSVGQYDDLFDNVGDKSSVGQFDDLFEVQEPTEEENEKNGEGGQSGRLFDNTGENLAEGQFDGLVDGTGKGENTAATLQEEWGSFNELNKFLNNTIIGNSSGRDADEQQSVHAKHPGPVRRADAQRNAEKSLADGSQEQLHDVGRLRWGESRRRGR